MKEATQAGMLTWAKIAASISEVLLPIIVVRFLRVEEVGAIVALLLIYRTLATVLAGGFPRAVLYFLAEGSLGQRRATIRRLNLIMVFLAGCLALSLLLVASIGEGVLRWIEEQFGGRGSIDSFGVTEILRCLPLMALYAFMDLPVRLLPETLIAEGRPRAAALYAVAISAGSALVVLIPVLCGHGVGGVAVGHLVLGALLLTWHIVLMGEIYGAASASGGASYKRLTSYSFPLGVTAVVDTVLTSLDLWLVMLFLSIQEVAYYKSGAWQLPVVSSLAMVVGAVFLPRFTRMFNNGERREALAIWRHSARKLALVVVPVAMAIFVTAEELIAVLFTASYVDAAPVFRCYCILAIVRVADFGSLLIAAGKPGYVLRSTAWALAINFAVSCSLVVLMGYVGPAIGTASTVVPMLLASSFYVAKAWGVNISQIFPLYAYLRVVATAGLPAMIAYWIKAVTDHSPFATIALTWLVVFGGFAAIGSLSGLIVRSDWRFARSWLSFKAFRMGRTVGNAQP